MGGLAHHDQDRSADHCYTGPEQIEAVDHCHRGSSRTDRPGAWLHVLRRYIAFIVGANLLWEIAQLPLYTIWSEGSVMYGRPR